MNRRKGTSLHQNTLFELSAAMIGRSFWAVRVMRKYKLYKIVQAAQRRITDAVCPDIRPRPFDVLGRSVIKPSVQPDKLPERRQNARFDDHACIYRLLVSSYSASRPKYSKVDQSSPDTGPKNSGVIIYNVLHGHS